ncbi:hypothetical protein OHT57_06470 [Streptomyces sp. NBC_00285]|uniref:hypothetical protein n=1 Tax=Streptomyces sp. NBC_00285 TaxID=2975700 RepID=UPI002E27BFFE|nr:hypothetical protein [Streptomyces sp. NBC_00285]
MDNDERINFIECYVRVLTRAWCDTHFCEELKRDPVVVLTGIGMRIHDDARVSVVRLPSQEPDLEFQAGLWEEGERSGHFVLQIPALDLRELSEEQLGELVGGSGADMDLYRRLVRRLFR